MNIIKEKKCSISELQRAEMPKDSTVATGICDSPNLHPMDLISTPNQGLETRTIETQPFRLNTRSQQTLAEIFEVYYDRRRLKRSFNRFDVERLIMNLNGQIEGKLYGHYDIYFGSGDARIKTGSYSLYPTDPKHVAEIELVAKALLRAAQKGLLPKELLPIKLN